MSKESIGFIGVGLMGHGMAANILEKGYPLTVMGHRNREPVEDLKRRGALEAKTLTELAEKSTIIFLCVTGSPQVEAMVRAADGLKNAARGTLIVDCSTSNPVSTIALAEELEERGITLVDAPLGGTPQNAEAGTLQTMVGCDDAVFNRLQPVLESWAAKITRFGHVGDGHKMKLINNFFAIGYGALYAEAFTLAQKAGISPKQVDEVIRNGRMDCGFYQTFTGYILEGNAESHKFSIRNALKDLLYLEALADGVGIENPVGNAAKNSLLGAVNAGKGDDYVTKLPEFVASRNGIKFKPAK